MRKYILGMIGLISLSILLSISAWKSDSMTTKPPYIKLTLDSSYHQHVNILYADLHLKQAGLALNVFEKALTGFYNLKKAGQLSSKQILSIADFDQLSTKKRLYVIDLEKKEVLLNTWVAHGQKSGNNEAVNFSNTYNSLSSSLGFYITGEVYWGSHGKSLKLDGMDEGFNNNARNRSIVVHGAPYVSPNTINTLGRLGRSQGCPAVAPEVANEVIKTIADKTVLFINKSVEQYHSKYLDETLAANFANEGVSSSMD
jgi:L,D-transpeptidase catalytic domain